MVMRLSELLERIRPAGTPGAATDVEGPRERARVEEISQLAAILHRLEAEADEIVAEARAQAASVRSGAEEEIEHARTELTDRLAVARAAATRPVEEQRSAALEEIDTAAGEEIDRRRAHARAEWDRVVRRVVETVWELVPDEEAPR